MSAPDAAARVRAKGRAPRGDERASNSRAHQAHLAPEEHASDTAPSESRGLGAIEEAECSSTASSQSRGRAHGDEAAAIEQAAAGADRLVDGAERTAAKREKRRFVAEPLREVAGLRGLFGGSGTVPNGRFPWLVGLVLVLAPAPAHAPGPREAGTCLQPAAGRGRVRFSHSRARPAQCLGPFSSGSIPGN